MQNWDAPDKKYLHNQRLGLIKIKNSRIICKYFLYFVFNSWLIRTSVSATASGTKVKHTSPQKICDLIIPIPPLPEQRKIADILSTWDKAIALLEQLITAKRKLKQGLMQQLLTRKKRFKEFEGSECSIVKLSEVATIRRGASPRPIQDPKWFAETGRGWVRIKDVTASNTYLTQTSQYLSNLAVEKSVKVDPGDLIMSICATIGIPRIVGIPACIHDGFVVFRGFEKQIDKFFLYHYINFISSRISDSGQPGTQKNINTTIVGNIEVPKFSLEEQQKIASTLSAADAEISNLEKQLAAYKQQKRGLMQQLLTGKKRVKIDEPQMQKV
ncbi:restriction endonuclease subunit S [Nostoc sp. FACHB-888]|uniref:restriction endonuclease subunit S n=1 Tax=Nostoc sp. FACHB-888 TaxID=2692842 RepID=UPI001687E6F8|nr:restriction endonuclease subunit S [Nostoc sp. FACHB-888]MBD2249046.1 restriction endonuclease subunit S [Nostoc sp. FACHB-888]